MIPDTYHHATVHFVSITFRTTKLSASISQTLITSYVSIAIRVGSKCLTLSDYTY